MKRSVRILSGVIAFLAVLFGVCMLLTLIGWPVSPERLQELIDGSRRMPTVLFAVLSALLICAGGVFVLYGLIKGRLNRRTSALLEKTALGETAVSFASLAQIAEQTVIRRPDVGSCKIKVYAIGSSVRIDVRVVTSPTSSLLELTHTLQDEIAASIAQFCGTPIGTVDVTVDQTDAPRRKS